MLCALIMAGGKGTRFWPLSTEEKPKQFLKLIDDETMIQRTINRIKPIIPLERIFVCTGRMYVDLVRKQVPELPQKNILIEPEGRNTAPCIALSTFIINKYFKDSNIIVLPSDHLIRDEEGFRKVVKYGNEFLEGNQEALITLGIKPTRAETNYGYIKYDKVLKDKSSLNVLKVDSFVEKPNKEKAEEYLKEGKYLWNAGMFMWNANTILGEIKRFSKVTYDALKDIEKCDLELVKDIVEKKYSETEATSIDYAVLEKTEKMFVIPSNIGWDDIGSWEAIQRYRDCDINGNVNVGNVSCVQGKNNLVVASSEKIIIDGLSDIYLIENDGNIILGKRNNVCRVKDLKNLIIE